MEAEHPCGLCSTAYKNRAEALRCCGDEFDDVQDDEQPELVPDGGRDGSITVARDDRRISALVDGAGFAVLATTDGKTTTADVRAALRDADEVLARLDDTESLDDLDPLPDGEQRTGVKVRE